MTDTPSYLRFVPAAFVVLWSSGWIAAGFAAPYSEPLTFLSARYAIAAAMLWLACTALAVTWPRGHHIGHAMICGVLLQGLYLTGVWWSVMHGLPVAISGLISALQPIFTAMLAPWLLGETITRRQWTGVGLGFLGIVMVLSPALARLPVDQLNSMLGLLAVNMLGMVSVTAGTFYQKRFVVDGDVRAITTLQNAGALAATLPLALMTESLRITWNLQIVLTMAWAVLGMSIGAVALLSLLIRHGAVSKAAALIYLMPPMVAFEAFLFLGETLTPPQMLGMAVTVVGVWLAVSRS